MQTQYLDKVVGIRPVVTRLSAKPGFGILSFVRGEAMQSRVAEIPAKYRRIGGVVVDASVKISAYVQVISSVIISLCAH